MKNLFIFALLFGFFGFKVSIVCAAVNINDEIKYLKEKVKNNSSLIMSIRLLIEEDFSNIKPGMEEVAKKRAINGLEIVAKDKERFQERSKDAEDILKLYQKLKNRRK